MIEYTFNGVCKGTTRTGAACRHRVVFANGYCKQHGGNSVEYMRELARHYAEKSRRRTASLYRKLRRAGYKVPDCGNV